MILRLPARIAAFLAALAASTTFAAPLPMASGPSEVITTEKVSAKAVLRLSAKAATPRLQLPAVAEHEVEVVRKANRAQRGKRLMIGVNRDAPLAPVAPQWTTVEGGYAARLSASSPDAQALRLAIELRGLPLDAQMVFFGSGDERLVGPVSVASIADLAQSWWSPVTEGDVQTVEFFIPTGHDVSGLAPRIVSASHLFTSASSRFSKRPQDIGDSGSCNIDIQCVVSPSQALLDARNSVAHMVFTIPAGTSLCTGTALVDLDTSTQVPWFYGANHCFDNENAPFLTPAQMQTIASTLQTYWFFEAATCGSQAIPNFVLRTGGATYIYNNADNDVLFLRLNELPPAGAVLTAWDANVIGASAIVTSIHHPQGDLKKFSQGTVQRFSSLTLASTPTSFIEVLWQQGTTEGGSSGAGIWTFNGQFYVYRGGLWGGTALCTNTQGTDNFSRFDQAYPALAPFLAAGSTAPNYTALWWNPSESGWGINLTHQADILFATLFTYDEDGQAMWLVASNLAAQPGGTFAGELYRLTGPPFFQSPWNPAGTVLTTVGTMSVGFSDASNGTLIYTFNGATVTKAITRQIFSSPVPTCTLGTGSRAALTNYTDLWWNSPAGSESGWGINFTHQGNILFATLFNYDGTGRDLWLVASAMNRQADGSYSGELYITTGPPFDTVPWRPINLGTAGTMSARFSNGENGVLTYTVGGNTVSKNITRQVFGATVPFCR
jgi:hypothetical protein